MDWREIAAKVLSYEFGLHYSVDDVDAILADTFASAIPIAPLRARAAQLARFLKVIEGENKSTGKPGRKRGR